MATWSIELPSGAEYVLNAANGVKVKAALGERMAPVENISTNYALVDGALHQRTAVRPRILTFILAVTGTSVATLYAFLDALVTATNPHRPTLPCKIWYRSGGAGTGRYINGYYDGGLDGQGYKGYTTNNIPLRFRCDEPYWRGETDVALGWELDDGILLDDGYVLDAIGVLYVHDSMVTPNRIIQRDANGAWDNMDAGADARIFCLLAAPSGDVYAGGWFGNIGGVAASYIARWDYATSVWVAMGAGCDNYVYALAMTANGDLYVGGDFHNAGGGAALHIAKWVNSTTTWSAVGAGLDNVVSSLVVAPNGDLFVGGSFLNVSGGGIAVANVARWTAAGAWAALGAGVDNYIESMAIAPNGDLYVGGAFLNAGGAGAVRVAKWNGTAWSALSTGVNQPVYAMAVKPNGELYAGGDFTTAGGVNASRIAKWNGVSWEALGAGASSTVRRMKFNTNGDLYVCGYFATLGGMSAPMRWGIWNGSSWVLGYVGSLDIGVTDFVLEPDRIIFSGVFTAATTPGVTTINNTGSANGYPVMAITGPGRLLYLINYTTNQVIYFDITLVVGESLTIDLRPGYKTITSSFRNNMISGVLAGALTNFYLRPGDNYIGCYVDNAAATGAYIYTPLYWGAA